uniref:MADF domain-containing protein n=1 Tax=Timema bartmani TaxID=61472 RepID=A0A7R9EU65_9NEOP|nr:unnamed protein product [Timema bartmani]
MFHSQDYDQTHRRAAPGKRELELARRTVDTYGLTCPNMKLVVPGLVPGSCRPVYLMAATAANLSMPLDHINSPCALSLRDSISTSTHVTQVSSTGRQANLSTLSITFLSIDRLIVSVPPCANQFPPLADAGPWANLVLRGPQSYDTPSPERFFSTTSYYPVRYRYYCQAQHFYTVYIICTNALVVLSSTGDRGSNLSQVQRDLKTRTRAQVAELPKAWSATGNQAKSLPLNNIELKMMITIIATETSTGIEGIQEIGFGDDSLLNDFLYNTNSESYKDRDKRLAKHKEISEALQEHVPGCTAQDVKKKINGLRSQYLTETMKNIEDAVGDES